MIHYSSLQAKERVIRFLSRERATESETDRLLSELGFSVSNESLYYHDDTDIMEIIDRVPITKSLSAVYSSTTIRSGCVDTGRCDRYEIKIGAYPIYRSPVIKSTALDIPNIDQDDTYIDILNIYGVYQ